MSGKAVSAITIIGAGRVGWHLAHKLSNAGFTINVVWSRTYANALELAKGVNAEATSSLDFSNSASELFILSLADEAYRNVIDKLQLPDKAIVIHTSGSLPMEVLAPLSATFGVFYPLQTFSREKEVLWSEIPLCLEASTPQVYNILADIASKISSRVVPMSSEQRRKLHIAAVFACNFSNHMLAIGSTLLQRNQLPHDILNPLIKETLEKALAIGPKAAQTGPARRNDQSVIQAHLRQLQNNSEWQDLYRLISEDIIKNS